MFKKNLIKKNFKWLSIFKSFFKKNKKYLVRNRVALVNLIGSRKWNFLKKKQKRYRKKKIKKTLKIKVPRKRVKPLNSYITRFFKYKPLFIKPRIDVSTIFRKNRKTIEKSLTFLFYKNKYSIMDSVVFFSNKHVFRNHSFLIEKRLFRRKKILRFFKKMF